jgi:predicted nucleotidyltransferase
MVKSQTRLNSLIRRAVNSLKREIEIEAAVLFGSYAGGNPDEFSDIDLAVFSRTVKNWDFEQKLQLSAKLKKIHPLLELHLYDTTSLKEARPTNFFGHILETGKRVA